jgi:XRE family transcriptional regulator, regulator of sulfur utilization
MTRRDVAIAVVTVACTLGLSGWARSQGAQAEVMGSNAWDFASLKATPNDHGEVRKVFQQPTATLDELECHITTLKPGESPHAPHKHPDEEVLVLKEGTIEAIQDGKTIKVGPGSVVFQAANHLHSVRNVGTTPATYVVIKWNSPGMLKKKAASAGE